MLIVFLQKTAAKVGFPSLAAVFVWLSPGSAAVADGKFFKR